MNMLVAYLNKIHMVVAPFLFSVYEVLEGNNKTLLFSFLVVLGGDFVIILLYIG